jgi:predicted aconitase with swiveling domain
MRGPSTAPGRIALTRMPYSPRVRRLLADGDAAGARVLGRPHQIRGTAVVGRVVIDPGTTPPASGSYRVLVGDSTRVAVVDGHELRVATTNGAVVVQFLDVA